MLSEKPSEEEPLDFSVVLGGPLFQLYRRLHLSGGSLELSVRRTVAVTLFAWVPLLFISMATGTAWRGVREPFLLDADVNARLLVALPLLVGSEEFVHTRIRAAVRQFIARGLVTQDSLADFARAESRGLRLRDSRLAELVLLGFVYAVGVSLIWHQFTPFQIETWYRRIFNGASHVTAAGYWYTMISLPLFQFVLFRWYFRLGIWALFLSRVARCDLKLVPTHPDRAGGLGFLTDTTLALVPFLLAHGTLFSGVMAVGIFFGGRTFASYGPALGAFSAFATAVVVAPLVVFVLPLVRAKRAGVWDYGRFAQTYVAKFDQKWLRSKAPSDDPPELLGTPDIEGLANIIQSFQATVVDMRLIPISPQIGLGLVIVTLLPAAPLLLTVMPAREILQVILKGIF